MSTYKGRVALVTGASSGIGAAIAEDLVKQGLIVVGAARRVDRIQAVSDKLNGQPGRLIAKKLDISNAKEIEGLFGAIEKELGGVDVLVNNAAVWESKPIHENTVEQIKFIVDVNQTGVLLVTREAINGFIRRKVDDGYIININSVTGHNVPYMNDLPFGVYPSTKYAMTGACQLFRHDFKRAGMKCRVTSVSPGAVDTEMTTQLINSGVPLDFLTSHDVARTVTFLLTLPKSIEVTELTVRPTNEVF